MTVPANEATRQALGWAIADRASAEHAELDAQAQRMEWLEPEGGAFEVALPAVLASGRRHIAQQERDLFRRLQQTCTRSHLRDLGDQLCAAQQLAPVP